MSERKGKVGALERQMQFPAIAAAGFKVNASQLGVEPAKPSEQPAAWAVSMTLGDPTVAQFVRYMSPRDARELAAALVSAADFYDAETARLVAAGVQP